MHELDCEPAAEIDHLGRRARIPGEGGVERAEAEAVLQVADGVHERRVALLDDVVEVVLGLVRLEAVLGLEVALVVCLLQLLEEHLEVGRSRDDISSGSGS